MTYKPFTTLSATHLVLLFTAMAVVVSATYVYRASGASSEETPHEVATATTTPSQLFNDDKITAHAVMVYDLKRGEVLYEKNAHSQLPLASVAKLMTALVASESLSDASPITISEEALSEEGESGLTYGESWYLPDLLDFTLITSSNDGAAAVALYANEELPEGPDNLGGFVESMNAYAKSLGLKQTYFLNPTGLDISLTHSGAYGSARDMTMLMAYLLRTKPELLVRTRDLSYLTDSIDASHLAENTNELVGTIPGLIASKTGYTDLAGGNLVIAFDASIGHPVVVVVLGSTKDERFSDAIYLSDIAREVIHSSY